MAETKPDWVKIKPAELEEIIIDLHKKGESPAKIGMIIRDKHGVPKARLLGKRITQILKKANLEVKPSKEIIIQRIKTLENHLSSHKHDQTARRSLNKRIWGVANK